MIGAQTYADRRQVLQQQLKSGLVVFMGNDESPMNYRDNTYPYRQDSSFLYYWGLSSPGLAAVLDVDENRSTLFGDEASIADIVWTGPQPRFADRAERVGVDYTERAAALAGVLSQAVQDGRRVHFLPQYRADSQCRLEAYLGLGPGAAVQHASKALVRVVIAQRSVKDAGEIAEIETALAISRDMHVYGMREARPGRYEREVAGAIEGIAIAGGGRLAFPIIFSRRGQILHNHAYDNRLQDGDLVVNDSGASSRMGYASDITRTIPVSGRFSDRQRAIYQAVLGAQERALAAIQPGVRFRDVHLIAARSLASDLKDLGLMKGDVDEAVAAGAHALFFPHGLGHHMGLDVHDLEGLGEDLVGYDEETRRDQQFGLGYLRLGKALQQQYVVTVEPGCYFIGPLIDQWRADRRHEEFIKYDAVDAWRGLGGVRIEDDVLVTNAGARILGPPIPKSVADVEATCER